MGRQTDIGDGVTEAEPACTKNKLLFDGCNCIVQSLWVTYIHCYLQLTVHQCTHITITNAKYTSTINIKGGYEMKGVEMDDEDKDSVPVCTVQSSSSSSSSVEETMLQLRQLTMYIIILIMYGIQ